MSKATAEQRRSIQPDSHVWVMASAGSGKTHVLSERVLRLLLEGERPESILCLTFTKAAAAEMQARVFRHLAAMVHKSDEELALQLTDMGVDTSHMVHARTLFARTLDARGGLKILTIHAFCQSLLARYPLEAELPPGFGTIDDLKAQTWLRESVEAEMRDSIGDSVRQADWTRLAELRQDAQLFEDISKYTRALEGGALAELTLTAAALPAIRASLGLPRDGDAKQWLEQKIAAGAIDLPLIDHICEIWNQSASKNQLNNLERIALWRADMRPAHFSSLMRGFSDAKGDLPSERTCTEKSAGKIDPDIFAKSCSVHEQLKPLYETLLLFNLADESATLARICLGIRHRLQQKKIDSGLINFEDLIYKAGLLMQDPMAQWVLYKMDDRIRHILVDESQDTSSSQWRIIDAIAAEFFVGNSAAKAGRTIFAVGDEKQSIYGFQGSEPQLFDEKRIEYKSKADAAEMLFDLVPLSLSFRSSPCVIDFVNQSIDTLGAPMLGLARITEPHRAYRDDGTGSVTIWQAIDADMAETLIANVAEDLTAPWRPDAEQLLAFRIAEQIEAWLSGAENLSVHDKAGGYRNVQAGDILILVQKRSALMTPLVSALKARNIAVAGIDRIKLLDQLVVQDVLSVVQFALLPQDDLNLAALLKSPFIGLDEGQLMALACDRGTASLWSRVRSSDDPACKMAHIWLDEVLDRADQMPPFAFLSRLLDAPTGRVRLLSALGTEVADPLNMLMDAALRYEQDEVASLQGFLHWLNQQSSDIKRDADQARDQVRLMTVHGAKGLEAPVVIVADACGKPSGKSSIIDVEGVPIWYRNSSNAMGAVAAAISARRQHDNEEYWRLYYVAITRAADHLFITGWHSKKASTDKKWFDLAMQSLEQMHAPAEEHLRWEKCWRVGTANSVAENAPRLMPESAPVITQVRAAPQELRPARPLSPSRLGDEPPPQYRSVGTNPQTRERGIAIHRLLELLPNVPAAERATTAERLLRQTPLDAASLNAVLALLEDKQFADVFAPHALAEAPISALLPDGAVLSGQIDRLLIREAEILIVDYKTGSRVPTRVEDVPVAYLRQMAAYRWALQRIWSRPVRAALLWTDAPLMMPLPEELLDVYAPASQRS